MFDLARWQKEAQHRLLPFLKRPRREPFLAGTSSLLVYLITRTLEPFLEAYEENAIEATLALAAIDRGAGANFLVRNAPQLRYQGALLLRRELAVSAPLRQVVGRILLKLGIIELVKNGLDDIQGEWFRLSLLNEIERWTIGGELKELRDALDTIPWQSRYAAIQSLRRQTGEYSSDDLALLESALRDSSNHVRSAAARILGQVHGAISHSIQQALLETALHDHDLGTRYAAARALGTLRGRIAIDEVIDQLTAALVDEDSFVRSAAGLVIGQLGLAAAQPRVIGHLTAALNDRDPYVREAAAQALGLLGETAASEETLAALTAALHDTDFYVHNAASSALSRLQAFAQLPEDLIRSELVV